MRRNRKRKPGISAEKFRLSLLNSFQLPFRVFSISPPNIGLPVHIERDFAPCQASIGKPLHARIPSARAERTEIVSPSFMYGMSKNAIDFGKSENFKTAESEFLNPTDVAFITIEFY